MHKLLSSFPIANSQQPQTEMVQLSSLESGMHRQRKKKRKQMVLQFIFHYLTEEKKIISSSGRSHLLVNLNEKEITIVY